MENKMKPTEKEIEVAIETINALALFAANHGVWTTEVPELVKTLIWLKTLKDDQPYTARTINLPPPRSDGE